MVAKRVVFLSSFVVLEHELSQIVAKVSDKCRTWFVVRIGDMGSHQHEAILAQIIEIKVSQSGLMLILELVR